jgi:tetratricopeptide (TPR) repeat protein
MPARRVELANLYLDAERFEEAVRWYEEALKIDPKNVNASTDLGVAYYYTNQADRALAQFERSLEVDPRTRRRC